MIELCVITANVLNMMIMRKVLALDQSSLKIIIFLRVWRLRLTFIQGMGKMLFLIRMMIFFQAVWLDIIIFIDFFSTWQYFNWDHLDQTHRCLLTRRYTSNFIEDFALELPPAFSSFLLWHTQGLLNLSQQINAHKSKNKSLCNTYHGEKEGNALICLIWPKNWGHYKVSDLLPAENRK